MFQTRMLDPIGRVYTVDSDYAVDAALYNTDVSSIIAQCAQQELEYGESLRG